MSLVLNNRALDVISSFAENLVDTPRRSATKAPPSGSKVKEEGQGQGAKSRKRKLEALQPQATSTPTPNRKHDTASPKKRKSQYF